MNRKYYDKNLNQRQRKIIELLITISTCREVEFLMC